VPVLQFSVQEEQPQEHPLFLFFRILRTARKTQTAKATRIITSQIFNLFPPVPRSLERGSRFARRLARFIQRNTEA